MLVHLPQHLLALPTQSAAHAASKRRVIHMGNVSRNTWMMAGRVRPARRNALDLALGLGKVLEPHRNPSKRGRGEPEMNPLLMSGNMGPERAHDGLQTNDLVSG